MLLVLATRMYLLKSPAGQEDHPFIQPTLARGVTASGEPHEYSSLAGEPLSSRQLQILQWLLDGKSNREISQLAILSEGTVKNISGVNSPWPMASPFASTAAMSAGCASSCRRRAFALLLSA